MYKNVYVIGVFDLFHRGHVEFLKKAKSLGQNLIIAENGDDMVASYKRKRFYSETDRLEIIKSCKYVNEAFIIKEYDNKAYIEKYEIDAIVLKFISKYAPLPLVYTSSFVISKKMIKLGQCYKTPKELSKVIKVKFEDMKAYIPIGWESYLKRMYGNYMQLPPVEKQRGHHSEELPDPFTPCEHKEVLNWKNKALATIPN